MTLPFPFDNSYARLPARFYQRVKPTPVGAPSLIALNQSLAQELGIDEAGLTAAVLSGSEVPEGAEPLAMAYAGHQFGHFVPQLGDGRAILLGEVVDHQGRRRDIQLKGSGLTAFSRRGDGRAAMGPVLREYLVSEAMAAFGIPTTRALSAVATGETVYRDMPQPGAVLTRVAASHIRVGTFQYFAARQDMEAIRQLADYAIARHYPEAAQAENPYLAFFDQVIAAQASLISRWLLVGFIHGVMNTDNCAISGETIDFGPCAFMDAFDPDQVFSSIDQNGRYAYGNQARIARWNLTRLAECLLPLFADEEGPAVALAEASLDRFEPLFQAAYLAGLRGKLGLLTERGGDLDLAHGFLAAMAESGADFTIAYRRLCDAQEDAEGLRALFADTGAIDGWLALWRARLAEEGGDPAERRASMRRHNPAIIPRNHRIEAVIRAAVDKGDFAPFHEMREALAEPFADRPDFALYEQPPLPDERVLQTFCGT